MKFELSFLLCALNFREVAICHLAISSFVTAFAGTGIEGVPHHCFLKLAQ
jgi:hypothetical protein